MVAVSRHHGFQRRGPCPRHAIFLASQRSVSVRALASYDAYRFDSISLTFYSNSLLWRKSYVCFSGTARPATKGILYCSKFP